MRFDYPFVSAQGCEGLRPSLTIPRPRALCRRMRSFRTPLTRLSLAISLFVYTHNAISYSRTFVPPHITT